MPSRDAGSTSPPEARAPVEAGAGVLVHSRKDREIAVGTWLLAAVQDMKQARTEWQESGIALLRCGGLFGAIRVSADLVRAAAGTDNTREIDAFLAEALLGGPVFLDLYAQRYYVLVPVSAGKQDTWAARRDPEVEFLGRGCFLGVPRPDSTEPEGVRSYWCVPMDGPGNLAVPDAVSQLLAVARFRRAKAERGSR
ncbi:hypothetical protein [Streptomyces sp. NPDC002845]